MHEIIKVPKILLPKKDIDMNKYAVIACDQFTSQMNYWKELESLVGDSVSTLSVIFPEIYLSDDNSKKIAQINENMLKMQKDNIFDEYEGLILVERKIKNGKTRLGLMLSINLDDYDYTPSNEALIKATEKTVVERLPVRIQIRENATLEFPHIMLLMDDKKEQILKKLYAKKDSYEVAYDFQLNMNGGCIKGYKVADSKEVINDILSLLKNDKRMLFAVGDGNHSLATAKECWNKLKANGAKEDSLAKYALCELVSLYDDSLEFEPIHRVILNAGEKFIEALQKNVTGKFPMKVVYMNKEYTVMVKEPSDAIKDVQDFTDNYMKEHKEVKIDYIHGDDYLLEVANDLNGVAIFMPTLQKDQLFSYVIRRGVLPRKAFSMGIAEDKRYYLEGRKILN